MNIDEKMKNAALEAEIRSLAQLPEDGDIDWTPSERHEAEMSKKLSAPKRVRAWRRIAVASAAAVLAVTAAAAVPLLQSESEHPSKSADESIETPKFYNNTVSEIEINAQPEYVPEGYQINSCTVWADGSLQIEYINGENKILFQSYPASEVDLSAFEEVVGNVDINGNEGFAANNFNGMYSNNIAWNDGNYSYVITNSDGVLLEELVRIALSVNTEDEKTAGD